MMAHLDLVSFVPKKSYLTVTAQHNNTQQQAASSALAFGKTTFKISIFRTTLYRTFGFIFEQQQSMWNWSVVFYCVALWQALWLTSANDMQGKVHNNISSHGTHVHRFKILKSHKKVIVVFNLFLYTVRPNWKEFARELLVDLNKNGLAVAADEIHVAISADNPTNHTNCGAAVKKNSKGIWPFSKKTKKKFVQCDVYTDKPSAALITEATEMILEQIPNAIITVTVDNLFEFPGLNVMWNRANAIANKHEAERTLFLLFHPKGIFHQENQNEQWSLRDISWTRAYTRVIDPWPVILKVFADNPTLNKAGYACGPTGNVWLNYYWVRGSYLQKLIPPVPSTNRYTHEGWLGMLQRSTNAQWPHVHNIEYPFDRGDEKYGDGFRSFQDSSAADCLSLCDPGIPIGKSYEAEEVPWYNP